MSFNSLAQRNRRGPIICIPIFCSECITVRTNISNIPVSGGNNYVFELPLRDLSFVTIFLGEKLNAGKLDLCFVFLPLDKNHVFFLKMGIKSMGPLITTQTVLPDSPHNAIVLASERFVLRFVSVMALLFDQPRQASTGSVDTDRHAT